MTFYGSALFGDYKYWQIMFLNNRGSSSLKIMKIPSSQTPTNNTWTDIKEAMKSLKDNLENENQMKEKINMLKSKDWF